MSSYAYNSNDKTMPRTKLFGRKMPMHKVLGGGKVADELLWKNKNVSGGIVIGMTLIWLLFEVVGYNFVTLLSHISITTMLIIFICCTGAQLFNCFCVLANITIYVQ
ncbi:reticulon-like protein B9 [Mercurialis annua]|uniref:reticulon-like protein B9 n=1 Tax=Mercurialis annua TaxID=3986 RepID=UPI00215E0E3E|nr:reticulon-like protein B9 [Mercurialis annua]